MEQHLQTVYRELFEKYYAPLFSYACSILGEGDAEDVVEDVFTDLWQRRDKLEFGDQIQSFLYRAVYTRSINVLKHRKVSMGYVQQVEMLNQQRQAYVEHPQVIWQMEHDELVGQVDTAVNTLPDKCQEVFRMSYEVGLKNGEIAQALNISTRTVEAHLYKALRLLREKLRPKGG